MKKVEVLICLGSSCFSRGNRDSLEIIKSYIADNHLSEQINFKGKLCSNLCSNGPTLTINGIVYQKVSAAEAIKLIEKSLNA